MVNGAPQRWTISPQPHGPRWFDAAATQVLSGLGSGNPVLYASDINGPGVKERLARRLLASLPGRETGGAARLERGPVILEKTVLGQPRLSLKGQPGPAVSFSQAAGCLWAALTPAGQVGVDAALPSEFEEGYPMARAFREAELDWARPLSGGDTAGPGCPLSIRRGWPRAVNSRLTGHSSGCEAKPVSWPGRLASSRRTRRSLAPGPARSEA